jgi:hypothetical protein
LHAIVALGGVELNAALTADGPPRPPEQAGLTTFTTSERNFNQING